MEGSKVLETRRVLKRVLKGLFPERFQKALESFKQVSKGPVEF
jgi:hypothetical protein